MEVHHHPHVEKKSFKEYVLEGLMIFIAVSMGFIAESIRESITDHEKEEQFMTGMVYDLKKDTANLSKAIKGNQLLHLKIDTNLLLINNPDKFAVAYDLSRLLGTVSGFTRFKNAKTTLVQLKSSGSLRLIKNIEIANAITNYDLDQETLTAQDITLDSKNQTLQELQIEIIDFDTQKKVGLLRREGKSEEERKAFLKGKKLFIKEDANLLRKYMNLFIRKQFFLETYIELMEKQRSGAIDLLKLIQEHYHLEK
jgi:phage anti-repressor protein